MGTDHRSVVIAFYNPEDEPFGEARQYGLETGAVAVVWRTKDSPRVRCPQWLRIGGDGRLVRTTAAEHMTAELLQDAVLGDGSPIMR